MAKKKPTCKKSGLYKKSSNFSTKSFSMRKHVLPQNIKSKNDETELVALHFAHKEACIEKKTRSPAQKLAISAFGDN